MSTIWLIMEPNFIQDNRHMIVSPTPHLQQKQNSLNLSPLVKTPMGPVGIHPMTHPSKVSKPSHIPRPAPRVDTGRTAPQEDTPYHL